MKGDARPTSSPYWLITGCEARRMEVFTVELLSAAGFPDGQRILPVFSYREEAEAFLEALQQDRLVWRGSCVTPASGSWRVRETTRGELVSLLCGACADVYKILLDPSPEMEAGMVIDLVGVGRASFVERLLGRGRAWFHGRHDRTSAPEETELSASPLNFKPKPDTKSPEAGSTPAPTTNEQEEAQCLISPGGEVIFVSMTTEGSIEQVASQPGIRS